MQQIVNWLTMVIDDSIIRHKYILKNISMTVIYCCSNFCLFLPMFWA